MFHSGPMPAEPLLLMLARLLAASPDDHEVLGQGMALFEGLSAITAKKP